MVTVSSWVSYFFIYFSIHMRSIIWLSRKGCRIWKHETKCHFHDVNYISYNIQCPISNIANEFVLCSIFKANIILKRKNIDCFWGYDKKKYWPLLNTNSHDTFLSDKSCHKICFMRLYSLEVLRQQTRNYMNLCKSYFEQNIPYKSFNHVRVLSDYKNIWNKNRNSQRHTTISFHVSFILYFWPFNSFVSLF